MPTPKTSPDVFFTTQEVPENIVKRVYQTTKAWVQKLPTEHLQEAAPLALAAFCQKENLQLSFSRQPCTDGNVVWLGPVTCAHPFAPIYIYGHGLHRRGHVLYSDFERLSHIMYGLDGELIFSWTNVLRDTRVDILTQKDYPGYSTWREALFRLYVEANMTPLAQPLECLTIKDLVQLYVLLERNVTLLRATYAEPYRLALQKRFIRIFGSATHASLLQVLKTMRALRNTQRCIDGAKTLIAFFRQACQEVDKHWKDLEKPVQRPSFQFEQQSLFEKPQARDNRHAGMTQQTWNYQKEQLITEQEHKNQKIHREEYGFDWERLQGNPLVKGEKLYENLLQRKEHQEVSAIPKYKKDALRTAQTKAICKKNFEILYAKTSGLSAQLENLCRAPVTLPRFHQWDGLDMDDRMLCDMALLQAPGFWADAPSVGVNTDIVFLLDSSGSMSFYDAFSKAKVLCVRLLESLHHIAGIQTMVAVFPGMADNGLERIMDVDDSIAVFHRKLADRAPSFGTPIYHALMWAGMKLVSRPQRRKIIFTITDGVFDESYVGKLPEYLKDYGIELATIYLECRAKENYSLKAYDDPLLLGKAVRCANANQLADAALILLESLLKEHPL